MRRFLVASPLVVLLTGCAPEQSTFNAHGPASQSIANLSWFMTITFLVVTLIMWGLIAWGFAKRRGTLEEHAPIDSGGGQAWIAIGGLAVPLLVLTVIFILGLRLLAAFPIHGTQGSMDGMTMNAGMHMGAEEKPEILIVGHQWWWEVHYLDARSNDEFTTANEIHIPAHRPINIELQSRDVMHSFWVPSLHGKVDLIPGLPNFIRIEASVAGAYHGQCAEYCGAQHAHMLLLVVAQEPDEYQAWLEQQRKPASEPTTPDAMAGQQTFLAGPCSLCHQIRGTLAGGSVAPDLTHVASRQYIAGNSFPNNDAYLEAWVTHAQSLKPEALMPDITQFNGQQLRGLVAYLRQLR
jgi:cytochrome c oxidase subunit 2